MEHLKILCTRDIPAEAKAFAANNNVSIHVLNFIETFPIVNVELQQEVEAALKLSSVVVFTSTSAVKYVASLAADENPDWIIYCIENTTLALVQTYFPNCKIAATAKDAMTLAEKIIEGSISESVYFFCGNKRRNELPGALENAGIEVIEIIVYETQEVHHKVSEEYAAILFFSPSAVHSFFAINIPGTACKLFAIGSTTAYAIEKHFKGEIITSDTSGKLNLLTKAIHYFRKN